MRLCVGVVSAIAALLTPPASGQTEVSKRGRDNLQELLALEERSGPLAQLTEAQYGRLVLAAPQDRPYDVIVIFAGPHNQCLPCKGAEKSVRDVAAEFVRSGESSDVSVQELKMGAKKPPTFFVLIDAVRASNTVNLHGVRTAPTIAMIHPPRRLTAEEAKTLAHPFPIERADMFPPDISRNVPFRQLLNWVNFKTGKSVTQRVTLLDRIGITGILMSVLVIISIAGWRMSLLIRRKPWILGCIVLLVQWVSTSGMFWSVQHSARWWGVDRTTGLAEFIQRSRRAQHFGEGVFMSLACVLFGSTWIGMAYIVKNKRKIKRPNERLIGLMVVAAALYLAIFKAHGIKTGVYHTPFLPPQQFVSGPLQFDRGNSF